MKMHLLLLAKHENKNKGILLYLLCQKNLKMTYDNKIFIEHMWPAIILNIINCMLNCLENYTNDP